MVTLYQITAAIIQANADYHRWSNAVIELALSESPDAPIRIAKQLGLSLTEKDGSDQPVSTQHLRQIIVSRMQAADRECHALSATEMSLVSTGKPDATETRSDASEPASATQTPSAETNADL